MASPILKQGSKGKLVTILQKFLNLKGKLPKPIPEDGDFGAETKEAVKYFQKQAGLTVDGTVGADTAKALAKLVGPAAASFAKAFGDPEEAGEKKGEDKKGDGKTDVAEPDEPKYTLTVKGKKYVFSKKEYEDFNKQMLSELKRTAVLAARLRADMARGYWDHFKNLNNDQYIVSWFVSLGGPKLPDEGIIKAGEQAAERLKSAVDSGDFRKIAVELTNASAPINKAYETMMRYKEEVIGRGETWVAGLEFTRDTSFEVVTVIATAEMGGSVGAGAAAGGGSELVKSAAGEFGKYLAGTSEGGSAAAKNIILDGILGAGTGAASTLLKLKGEKIIAGVAESAAKKMAGKWLGRLGSKAVVTFLTKRLEGAGKGALEAAVKNASKLIKGDTTPEQFFAEVAKGLGWGALLGGLDSWVQSKFAATVYDKMSPALRTKFFGKLAGKEAVDVLKDVISGKGADGVKKALEVAFTKATGSESAEALGDAAVLEFNNSSLKTLEAEIAKRVKKP